MLTELPAHEVFRIIHLDLAREPGHPEGSAQDRYTLVLPLDKDGRIDLDYCRSFPDLCRVAHASFPGGVHRGLIRRETDGTWTFDYGDADAEDEAGFRFSDERFTPGEYVSVIRHGVAHPYKVISLQPM
ncbi:MAG: hypothetical protein ACXU82_04250 [Caulobacteraceae bacterium]